MADVSDDSSIGSVPVTELLEVATETLVESIADNLQGDGPALMIMADEAVVLTTNEVLLKKYLDILAAAQTHTKFIADMEGFADVLRELAAAGIAPAEGAVATCMESLARILADSPVLQELDLSEISASSVDAVVPFINMCTQVATIELNFGGDDVLQDAQVLGAPLAGRAALKHVTLVNVETSMLPGLIPPVAALPELSTFAFVGSSGTAPALSQADATAFASILQIETLMGLTVRALAFADAQALATISDGFIATRLRKFSGADMVFLSEEASATFGDALGRSGIAEVELFSAKMSLLTALVRGSAYASEAKALTLLYGLDSETLATLLQADARSWKFSKITIVVNGPWSPTFDQYLSEYIENNEHLKMLSIFVSIEPSAGASMIASEALLAAAVKAASLDVVEIVCSSDAMVDQQWLAKLHKAVADIRVRRLMPELVVVPSQEDIQEVVQQEGRHKKRKRSSEEDSDKNPEQLDELLASPRARKPPVKKARKVKQKTQTPVQQLRRSSRVAAMMARKKK